MKRKINIHLLHSMITNITNSRTLKIRQFYVCLRNLIDLIDTRQITKSVLLLQNLDCNYKVPKYGSFRIQFSDI